MLTQKKLLNLLLSFLCVWSFCQSWRSKIEMLNSLSKFQFIRTIWELVFCFPETHSSPMPHAPCPMPHPLQLNYSPLICRVVRTRSFVICMDNQQIQINLNFHAPKWTHRPNIRTTGNHMCTLNPNVMYLYRHYDCFAAYCLPNFRIYFNLFAKFFLKMMESKFTVNYQALRTSKWITVSVCVCVYMCICVCGWCGLAFSLIFLKIFQWHSTFRNLSVFGNWGKCGYRNAHFVSCI